MSTLNLREKDRIRVVALAEKNFTSPIEIWAYGSRVNGDNHDGSDLDLVVKAKNNLPTNWNEFNNFVEALRDSNIPILVQPVDWAQIPESFKKNILKKYVVLFSNTDTLVDDN